MSQPPPRVPISINLTQNAITVQSAPVAASWCRAVTAVTLSFLPPPLSTLPLPVLFPRRVCYFSRFLPCSFFFLLLIHREYHREPLPSSRGKASRKRGNFGKISRPKRHPSCYPFFRGLRNNERCTEGGGGKGGKRRYSTNETRRKTYWAVKGFAVKGVVRLIGARPV